LQYLGLAVEVALKEIEAERAIPIELLLRFDLFSQQRNLA